MPASGRGGPPRGPYPGRCRPPRPAVSTPAAAGPARRAEEVLWRGGNMCRVPVVMEGVVVKGTVSPGLTYCP